MKHYKFVCLCMYVHMYVLAGDWLLAVSLWLRVHLSYVGENGILLNVQLYT